MNNNSYLNATFSKFILRFPINCQKDKRFLQQKFMRNNLWRVKKLYYPQ